jgi:Zn-dependent peptidase ImmA (M78 family)/transcriptional regulator with XRE-family HTH domain
MSSRVLKFPNVVPPKRRLVVSRLKDARIAMLMNQSELAEVVGVTRQSISAYEQGEKTPDSETLENIANILKQPISYFTSADAPDFGEFSSLFLRAVGPATKRRNMACSVLSRWFAQVTTYLDGLVNFPEVKVPHVAPSSGHGRYDSEEIEFAAEECRKLWQLGVGPISNLVSLLEAHGITVCRHELNGETVEAFSFWSGSRPFVILSSQKDSAARSRFDAAHELGHLILHRWIGADELEDPKKLREIEREADRFASAFLLPRKSFQAEIFTTRLDAFVTLKKRWNVSIQAMVYRCKQLELFDEDQVTNLYKQISARKWRSREPLDDPREVPLEQPRLLRHAVEMVVSAKLKMADEIAADLKITEHLVAEFCNLPEGFFTAGGTPEFVPNIK